MIFCSNWNIEYPFWVCSTLSLIRQVKLIQKLPYSFPLIVNIYYYVVIKTKTAVMNASQNDNVGTRGACHDFFITSELLAARHLLEPYEYMNLIGEKISKITCVLKSFKFQDWITATVECITNLCLETMHVNNWTFLH